MRISTNSQTEDIHVKHKTKPNSFETESSESKNSSGLEFGLSKDTETSECHKEDSVLHTSHKERELSETNSSKSKIQSGSDVDLQKDFLCQSQLHATNKEEKGCEMNSFNRKDRTSYTELNRQKLSDLHVSNEPKIEPKRTSMNYIFVNCIKETLRQWFTLSSYQYLNIKTTKNQADLGVQQGILTML